MHSRPADAAEGFGFADQDAALAQFIMALRARGIRRKEILIAFEKTPRNAFLPAHNPTLLYADYALPIACGAEATSPHQVAQLIGAIDVQPGMKVLEIGTGSGFQAAVLASIGCQVVTIERFQTLHLHAGRTMHRLGVVNMRLEHGDGAQGFADFAPYDRIIVNAAMRDVPDALIEQLAPLGTIIVPIQQGRTQKLHAFDDTGETFTQRTLGHSTYQTIVGGTARAL